MVRFLDKNQISTIASDDIMPITDISESTNDKKISIGQLTTYLSENLGNFAKTDLSNTNMLTDAILLAPNGVIVTSNNNTNIVAKSGMVLLFADGRNANGTLKSLQYTLSEDKTQTIATLSDGNYIMFLTNVGALAYVLQKDVYVSRTQPVVTSDTSYWYDIKNNLWKKTINTGSTWSNIYLNSLGLFTIANGVVTEIIPNTVAYIPNPEVLMLKDASNITEEGKERLKSYVNIDNKANTSLNNLDNSGEAHFSNPDMSNLSTTGKSNTSLWAFNNISIINLSGTSVTLTDNSVHYIEITGSTTFTLPTITDNSKFHQMLVIMSMPTVTTLNLGTAVYFNGFAPDLSDAGTYTLIYEYTGANWVVGSLYKAGV